MERDTVEPEPRPPGYWASAVQPRSKYSPAKVQQPLRYYVRPICIAALYLAFLIPPWVLICMISTPMTLLTKDVKKYQRWLTAIPILNSIATLLALTLVSELLAYGAVVYSQRRRLRRSLNLPQLLALSNRDWVTIDRIGATGFVGRSWYLSIATLLIILVFLQPPLQSYLVPWEYRTVFTCDEWWPQSEKWAPGCNGYDELDYHVVGFEPEPDSLAETFRGTVIQAVIEKMNVVTAMEPQSHLWIGAPADNNFDTIFNRYYRYDRDEDFTFDHTYWVSALPSNTTTGGSFQHSLRMNSSVTCQEITREEYPLTCTGTEPFVVTASSDKFGIQICVPGNMAVPAWEGHRDRQDIMEDLYIDAWRNLSTITGFSDLDGMQNMTVHCTGGTTRGYFEPGNFRNGYKATELLEKWPSVAEMKATFHDYDDYDRLLTRNGYPTPHATEPVTGPLMMAAMSLFGDGSFFSIAQMVMNATAHGADPQLCDHVRSPFAHMEIDDVHNFTADLWLYFRLDASDCQPDQDPEEALAVVAYSTALAFGSPMVAEKVLELTMYLVNEAHLVAASADGRKIWNKQGVELAGPRRGRGAIIAISCLIALQVLLLLLLLCYVYSVPTWTPTLDAMAMMRVGVQVQDEVELPPLGQVSNQTLRELEKVDGIIGLVEDGNGRLAQEIELDDLAPVQSQIPATPAVLDNHENGGRSPAIVTSRQEMASDPVSESTVTDMPAREEDPRSRAVANPRADSPPPPYIAPHSPESSVETASEPGPPYALRIGAPGFITHSLYMRYKPSAIRKRHLGATSSNSQGDGRAS